MKARKIDKFTPAPPGMTKVHIDYYMAYPKPGKKKARAPANKKAPAAKKVPSKNVTVRKPPKKVAAANTPLYWAGRSK